MMNGYSGWLAAHLINGGRARQRSQKRLPDHSTVIIR